VDVGRTLPGIDQGMGHEDYIGKDLGHLEQDPPCDCFLLIFKSWGVKYFLGWSVQDLHVPFLPSQNAAKGSSELF
jgi:hypothetical protein